jgi:hypothetical protein
MLVDKQVEGLSYKANQVVDYPDALAKKLIDGLEADASKAGVDYCIDELGAKPIKHEDAAEELAKVELKAAKENLDRLNAQVKAETDAGRRANLQVTAKEAAELYKAAQEKLKGE